MLIDTLVDWIQICGALLFSGITFLGLYFVLVGYPRLKQKLNDPTEKKVCE